jgi:2'-5' RNA ligase
MPKLDEWEKFNKIRRLYDDDIRCGPHITMNKPFAHSKYFDDISILLQAELSQFPPFEITLHKFDTFVKKTRINLHLRPNEEARSELTRLFDLVNKIFPECQETRNREFAPHLSMGNFRHKDRLMKGLELCEKRWKSYSWRCDEIYLMSKDENGKYQIRNKVRLGTALEVKNVNK